MKIQFLDIKQILTIDSLKILKLFLNLCKILHGSVGRVKSND
jgi:hypothetical protein